MLNRRSNCQGEVIYFTATNNEYSNLEGHHQTLQYNYFLPKFYDMKKSLLFTALIMTFCLCANAQNLLLNGDLEAGESHVFTNWIEATSNIRQELNNQIGGSRSVRLAGLSAPVYFSQDVNVEAGAEYTFTYTGRIQDAAGPSGTISTNRTLVGRIKALDGDDTSFKEVANISSGTNQTVTGTFKVPSGATKVRVQLQKADGIAYADDLSFTKATSTSIGEAKEISLTVTPNPSNGLFRITASETLFSVAVFNAAGQLVKSKKVYGVDNLTLDINCQSRGIYILKLKTSAGKLYTKKVMIN